MVKEKNKDVMLHLNQLDGADFELHRDDVRVIETNHNGKGSVITLGSGAQFVVSQSPEAVLEIWKGKVIL